MINPPYPLDTRARGWRFELDYEQIEQSDTWALAGEARPWLLMLWFTAWKQVPCGSLPADEEVIAAMIGVNPKSWAKHRKILLRGWTEATDGRLYHETLSVRVHEMMARRRRESDRKALQRAGTIQDSSGTAPESQGSPIVVPPLSHGTDVGLPCESTVSPAPITDYLLPTKEKKKPARKARTTLPDDFVVSERVQSWASEKGFDHLEKRFEHFIGYARRRGATYVDWDEALMSAIREDWAKIGSVPANGSSHPTLREMPTGASWK